MRDTNLLLTDANVQADAFAANALQVDKTPAEGIWLQFVITRNDGDADEVLDITVYGKDADENWATTDTPVGILGQIADGDVAENGTIIRYLLVQAKFKFLCPYYDVGASTTPDWTVVCGVVSGPDQPTTA
jgi:hypothetical protein